MSFYASLKEIYKDTTQIVQGKDSAKKQKIHTLFINEIVSPDILVVTVNQTMRKVWCYDRSQEAQIHVYEPGGIHCNQYEPDSLFYPLPAAGHRRCPANGIRYSGTICVRRRGGIPAAAPVQHLRILLH